MEPEEMRPEERWDRIVELLAIMAMPDNPSATGALKPVLSDDIGTRL